MNKILILVFVLFANSANAKDNKIEKYNTLIDSAEAQFSKGEHIAANISYGDAFKLFRHPLAVDLSNAMVNATKGENKAAFYKYANLFSQYGVQSSFFSKRKTFQYWNGSKEWNLLLTQTDENYGKFVSKNSSLRHYVDSLLAFAEQKKEGAFEPDVNIKDFRQATRLVSQDLLSLFETQGYISEDLVGVNIKNDTTIATSKILQLIEFTMLSPDGKREGEVEIIIIMNYEIFLTDAFNECKIGWRDYWANTQNINGYQQPPAKPSF